MDLEAAATALLNLEQVIPKCEPLLPLLSSGVLVGLESWEEELESDGVLEPAEEPIGAEDEEEEAEELVVLLSTRLVFESLTQ